jgi:glycosyltransferase involved in cell wall biosynthesis
MNVLHVDTERKWRGGEAQVFSLCRALADSARFHPIVLTQPDSPLGRRLAESGIESVHFPMRGEFDLRAVFRISRLCAERDIRLIHAHDAHAHSLAWLATMHRSAIPVLITRRVDFPVGGNLFSNLKYRSRRIHFIAISNGVKKVLLDAGVPEERIDVVFSGVDRSRFSHVGDGSSFKKEYGVREDEIVIGNVAALTDHKGQKYLINAVPYVMGHYPEARFFIIGEGELLPVLKQLAKETGVEERVVFTGFLSDVGEAYASMDLFVLSSHQEGLCTSLIDAMLMGVPVVATRAGGVTDVISHGECGLLVEPRNPQALAEAIERSLENQDEGGIMAEEAYQIFLKNYTLENMINQYEAVYKNTISSFYA